MGSVKSMEILSEHLMPLKSAAYPPLQQAHVIHDTVGTKKHSKEVLSAFTSLIPQLAKTQIQIHHGALEQSQSQKPT